MFLNFKEAFTFMFKDEKFWQKYLIGSLFAALITIPSWVMYPKITSGTISPFVSMSVSFFAMILGLFVYGFSSLYANSKITLKQDILPEWNKDFGKIVSTGLKYIFGILAYGIASLIALLPVFIILGIIVAIIMGLIMVPSIAAMGPNVNTNDPVYTAKIAGLGLIGLVIGVIIFLPVLLIWITSIYLSMTSFFTDLKFGSFFNIKRMWSMLRGNFLNLVLLIGFMFIYSIFVQILLMIIGYNLYFLLLLAISFYVSLVFHNLYAQFALIGIEKSAKRLEEKKAQEEVQNNPQENA